jgi:hypothetical protein
LIVSPQDLQELPILFWKKLNFSGSFSVISLATLSSRSLALFASSSDFSVEVTAVVVVGLAVVVVTVDVDV